MRKPNPNHRHQHYLYKRWYTMIYNCYNPSSPHYPNYQKFGIEVYPDWRPMKIGFDCYRDWVLENLGEIPSQDSIIRRKDVNGHYEPGNLEWSTLKIMGNNRRTNLFITYQGQTRSLSDWCRLLNLHYDTMYSRIQDYKFTPERAFNEPRHT